MQSYRVKYRWAGFFLITLSLILGHATISTAASRLNITWSDRSTNEAGFRIERKTALLGTYAQIAQVGANVTSFSDSTVTAGITYCYRVRAFNSAGNSAYSNGDCGTARLASFTLTVTKTGSGRVSSLAGIDCGSDCSQTYTSLAATIVLTATPASGYRFAGWSGGGCGSISICTLLINTNTTVTATFTRAGSDTTPPTAPGGFTATVVSSSQINLSWTAATDNVGVANYLVERCEGTGCTDFTQVATPDGTDWNNAGFNVSAGTTFRYRIRARDAAGYLGPYSSIATATFGSSSPAPTTGLVAAYSFGAGSGTTVQDSSGLNNTGTISGATWTTGKFGKALSFDGVNDLVTINDAASLDLTTGMTLEAWVYPTVASTHWTTAVLKEQSGALVYSLYARTRTDLPGAYAFTQSEFGVKGPTALPRNTWTHLAATYDGGTLRLYVNGVLKTSRTQTGTLRTSDGHLRIGGNKVWGNEYFQGRIDEVRIYNRALSATQIQTDMNAAVTP